MAIIQLKDGNGTTYNFSVSGEGTVENPYVPLSDLAVSGVPVSAGAPVPVSVDTSQNDRELSEQFTYDTNLEKVLGTSSVVTDHRLNTNVKFTDNTAKGRVGALGEAFGIDCSGCQTVLVQASGTWVGTLTFEARGDAGNWLPINGIAPNGTALVTTSTAGGVFRFNTAGHQRFQVRLSAYTSGTVFLTLIASAELSGVFIQNAVAITGTVATSGTDANVSNLLGATAASPVTNWAALTRPAIEPVPIVPQAPIRPTAYPTNLISRQPQMYSRLRVEIGGDQKLPLAQDPLNKKLLVQNDKMESLLEELLMQTKYTNQILMQAYTITPPDWWETVR